MFGVEQVENKSRTEKRAESVDRLFKRNRVPYTRHTNTYTQNSNGEQRRGSLLKRCINWFPRASAASRLSWFSFHMPDRYEIQCFVSHHFFRFFLLSFSYLWPIPMLHEHEPTITTTAMMTMSMCNQQLKTH